MTQKQTRYCVSEFGGMLIIILEAPLETYINIAKRNQLAAVKAKKKIAREKRMRNRKK